MKPRTKPGKTKPGVGQDAGGLAGATGYPGKALTAGAALFLLSVLLYWPSYRAGLIWDDELMLGNPVVQGGWAGLRDIWLTTKFRDFVPLTATSFWLEAQLGGATQGVRHTTNILLQALNVILVWQVCRRLRIPGAWVATAMFAAHPICVASVTWIAERKNILSMLFYLLSLLCYLRSDDTHAFPAGAPLRLARSARAGRSAYWLSVFFYILALLSKSSVVVLPVVFLLCAWWQRGRISRLDVWRVAPFFCTALAAGGTTLVAHYYLAPTLGGMIPITDNLLVRTLAGTRAVWFYLGKSLWPVNLTMHYPRWEINPVSLVTYLPGAAILAAFAVFWHFRKSWGRACLFGLGYFVLALAPTLGVLKMSYLPLSQVADHFQFLALPGLIAWLVGGAWVLGQRASPRVRQVICRLVPLLILPVLAALSWQHQRVVGDAEALWRDNLKKHPRSWVAHNNLGKLLATQGRFHEADEKYRAAWALYPKYYDIPNGLGVSLLAQGRYQEAVQAFSEALRLAPGYAVGEQNLASALMKLGREAEAVGHLREVLRLRPEDAGAESNLALVLSRQGKPDEAFEHYRRALQLAPADPAIRDNMGYLLAAQGKYDEALDQFAEVARVQPEDVQAQTGLANVLAAQGKTRQAAAHAAIVYFLLGREEANKDDFAGAKQQFRRALETDGAATIEFARQVCAASTPYALTHLDLLSATCVEAKHFAEATNALQHAIALAETAGQASALMRYRTLLEQCRRQNALP